jgi:polyisoprenoid-binding protein YceI
MNKKIINRRNIYFLVIVLLSQVFSYSLPAKPITYKLDENNSKVGFTVKHKITNDVNGEFLKSIGTVDYNSETNKVFNVESIIDVQSIDTGNAKRDQHLISPDFFDAQNYPKIYFKSNNVENVSENKYKVYGNLTMRGIKKEIILEGGKKTDINGDLFFHAISIINRQDFGISWNRPFQKIAGMMVSNEVKIVLKIKMSQM